MIQEAINKLRNEMIKENQEYINFIGEELIKVVSNSENVAEKIMEPGKSIVGALKVMEAEARKKMKGKRESCTVVIKDEEGMEIVHKYFDMDLKAVAKEVPLQNIKDLRNYMKKESIKESKKEFSVDLDDLF